MHLQVVWANHLHSTTSTNHTVATRERTFVIQAREFLWFRLTVHDMYNGVRAVIVMPRPLSVSQETIIVLQRSIRSVRCPETRESVIREFLMYNNIGKSIRARSCVRYNVCVRYSECPLRESWLYTTNKWCYKIRLCYLSFATIL